MYTLVSRLSGNNYPIQRLELSFRCENKRGKYKEFCRVLFPELFSREVIKFDVVAERDRLMKEAFGGYEYIFFFIEKALREFRYLNGEQQLRLVELLGLGAMARDCTGIYLLGSSF